MPRPGSIVPGFGDDGVVDLRLNDDQKIDLGAGADIGLHSAPLIVKDVVIIGAAHLTAGAPLSKDQH